MVKRQSILQIQQRIQRIRLIKTTIKRVSLRECQTPNNGMHLKAISIFTKIPQGHCKIFKGKKTPASSRKNALVRKKSRVLAFWCLDPGPRFS